MPSLPTGFHSLQTHPTVLGETALHCHEYTCLCIWLVWNLGKHSKVQMIYEGGNSIHTIGITPPFLELISLPIDKSIPKLL